MPVSAGSVCVVLVIAKFPVSASGASWFGRYLGVYGITDSRKVFHSFRHSFVDALPTVDLEVMSVSLRGIGDEPLIYYTDLFMYRRAQRKKSGG